MRPSASLWKPAAVSAEVIPAHDPSLHPDYSATLLYMVKQVELAIRTRLDDVTALHGVTTVQYTALTVLEQNSGIISAQLARRSFVRAQSMAQMVDLLESRGLLERTRDPSSRRQMHISLTPSGQALLDELREPVAEIEATMTAGLDEAQIESLRNVLHFCRANLVAPHLTR